LAHLRFSREDYRILACLCHQLDLGRNPRPAFRCLLVEALRSLRLPLADRIASLRGPELRVLHKHFRPPCRPKAEDGGEETSPEFTAAELRTLTEACVSVPFPARLARAYRALLVGIVRDACPELARKLSRLSPAEFARLYDQLTSGPR
jgi:hypothetical protein